MLTLCVYEKKKHFGIIQNVMVGRMDCIAFRRVVLALTTLIVTTSVVCVHGDVILDFKA